MASFSVSTIARVYRITGPQSVERLEPLLTSFESIGPWHKADQAEYDLQLDFVWETTCEMTWREKHNAARILNKLHNTHILESKSNLAFLQRLISRPMIETYVAASSSHVLRWAQRRWTRPEMMTGALQSATKYEEDWWVVKASNGNGGKDIWFMTTENFDEMCTELPQNTEYVIQKYVKNPMLYHGKKKFHFRCYSTIHADGSAMVYEKAFILTAGFDYDTDTLDPCKHITNLSVNKRFANHPGQIPCHVSVDYPAVNQHILLIVSLHDFIHAIIYSGFGTVIR